MQAESSIKVRVLLTSSLPPQSVVHRSASVSLDDLLECRPCPNPDLTSQGLVSPRLQVAVCTWEVWECTSIWGPLTSYTDHIRWPRSNSSRAALTNSPLRKQLKLSWILGMVWTAGKSRKCLGNNIILMGVDGQLSTRRGKWDWWQASSYSVPPPPHWALWECPQLRSNTEERIRGARNWLKKPALAPTDWEKFSATGAGGGMAKKKNYTKFKRIKIVLLIKKKMKSDKTLNVAQLQWDRVQEK